MADALPESTLAALDDPFAQLTGPLASAIRLDFEVVDSARLTPHMQRLRLTAPQLDGFGYLPGQDVMLLVAQRAQDFFLFVDLRLRLRTLRQGEIKFARDTRLRLALLDLFARGG